ncbi:galactokinase [Deinococcus deserti]|uniref:Galactokinase n=1 Tax=Deinococcus deserti (strain DSM 17065 / CIP 109153 / LMG 22923 / VCD115) TaxID=546414 RepID=C1D3A7_DEIDV|nr:galactokinase [Deinococcus deserti]ACO47896.1 putative galactokinase [Deinococcus deserti VCD115]
MKTFEDVYGQPSDITAVAPGRVNLLGEHTDYQGGFVLPTAITRTTTVQLSRNGTQQHRVYAADLDEYSTFDVGQNAPEEFARYVAGALALSGVREGLNLHITSTIPMGAGLSSSAALEVATLRGLRDLGLLVSDDVQIALTAQRVEHEFVGVQCGIMDQMASSLADSRSLLYLDTRSLDRELRPLPAGSEVLVLDSGVPRRLAESGYNERRAQVEEASRLLGVKELRDVQNVADVETLPSPLRERARHVVSENQRVQQAVQPGIGAAEFGALMNASHASLRDDYAVSHPDVDSLVELLQAHTDVYGARMTGAGFGGAVVALVRSGTAVSVADEIIGTWSGQARRVVP